MTKILILTVAAMTAAAIISAAARADAPHAACIELFQVRGQLMSRPPEETCPRFEHEFDVFKPEYRVENCVAASRRFYNWSQRGAWNDYLRNLQAPAPQEKRFDELCRVILTSKEQK
jgi:hypothetical protein